MYSVICDCLQVHHFNADMQLLDLDKKVVDEPIDLASIDNDAESRFILSAASSFNFRFQVPTAVIQQESGMFKSGSPVPRSRSATAANTASSTRSDMTGSGLGAGFEYPNEPIMVYGTLRYHPSLYGNETFPHTRTRPGGLSTEAHGT